MSALRSQLVIPDAAVGPIVADVQQYGAAQLDVETGGFLLAPADDQTRVTTVALAGEKGITRRRGLFRVSGPAIEVLFGWADDHDLRIPAQVHSHGREASLSATDQRGGFNVTGFISCVVPFFRRPPTDPLLWGWWMFDGRTWVPAGQPALDGGPVRVVTFDEDGVRP